MPGRWSRATGTLRFRTTTTTVALAALLLVVVGLLVIELVGHQLTDNLDEGLRQRADAVAASLREDRAAQLPSDEDILIQVVDGQRVVMASPNMAGEPPISTRRAGFVTVGVPGRSETFRVVALPVARSSGSALLLVGVNYDDVTDATNVVRRVLLVAVPAVLVVLGLLTWWLTGRTLAPVERMRAEMAQITGSHPERRVHAPGTGDEVDRLAGTMNDTLDRLEDGVRRQQRFVADASHELRGPLTRMRSELELALSQPPSGELADVARSVLAEAVTLQAMVDDLLLMARADAGVELGPVVPVDLDDIVLREVRRVRELGRVDVDSTAVSAAFVRGDPQQLARLVRNLLDNAERHARQMVTVTLREGIDGVQLTVADDGDGIPPGERERIFDRFTRLDEARSRDAGGTGLGLAIAREIAERHGGSIRLADEPSTCFVVVLPAPSGLS